MLNTSEDSSHPPLLYKIYYLQSYSPEFAFSNNNQQAKIMLTETANTDFILRGIVELKHYIRF